MAKPGNLYEARGIVDIKVRVDGAIKEAGGFGQMKPPAYSYPEREKAPKLPFLAGIVL